MVLNGHFYMVKDNEGVPGKENNVGNRKEVWKCVAQT